MKTMNDLLATADPARVALIGVEPDRSLTYRQLSRQIDRLAEALAASGLEPGARAAIVLPNGPEFIVVFLAVLRARLTAAPYNGAQAAELATLWEDAGIRAVIAMTDDRASLETAARLNLPAWPLSVDSSGQVQLAVRSRGAATRKLSGSDPNPDDVALFLHTSGTTSKPKGVPLTHANLMASIENIAGGYRLTADDRTLLVMPLFHVHGLIGAALSTLYSGGTVVAPRRFSANAFWPLARSTGATWYSAVPTIHRTLLLRADSDAPSNSGFRFIRSCSAALAPAMLAQMEDRFQAPVLEAYGMTEAAHQIATNPLPPAPHKAGSVGLGGRVEVAILDDGGLPLPPEREGEVAIKGANVMGGYDRNPAANAAAFVNGWLRTGDRGKLDAEGYVSLVGRIKELINRGGEKVSPAEIDAVLLAHPAVAEAASFGVPDEKYGEEVSAAIVLKGSATAKDLQAFCRESLADFKVPKVLHIVAELPKTATGKVQRNVLTRTFTPA
ncbi:MAG TPA: acyl--CoA ligase [Candidatus Binataceae bacterium]|nr:acyl--CoA ligase [Candidatus Binataceae bacterium]